MRQDDLKIYKTLGEIHSFVSSASTLDEAIRGELRIVVESEIADSVVVWYVNREKGGDCYPYYWIGSADLTARSCRSGEGIVGRVCRSNRAERYSDFEAEATPDEKELYAGIRVSSVVCVPISVNDRPEGCMEFIRGGSRAAFTGDEAEMCSILSIIAEMYIREVGPIPTPKVYGRAILSARGIRKSFLNGGVVSEVLRGVNIDVFDGELLCIQGESGCGKSTFLNIAGGLLGADGGSLTFMGSEITDMTEEALTVYRRDHVGFVFQSYNLMPNLTAKQNLDLIAELVREPMDTDAALALVGMREKGGNYPSRLSGGEQQRISIARALVKRPKLIFADEPTAALDYKTAIEILTVFEKVKETGTTILMVTHNEAITRMADRVIRFRDGEIYEVMINRRPVRARELKW